MWDEEISIGDFVLTGGEIPAMAVADSACRLVPMSSKMRAAYRREPLERPTGISPVPRPEILKAESPRNLLSGHHANIAKKGKANLKRTLRRPDMLKPPGSVSRT